VCTTILLFALIPASAWAKPARNLDALRKYVGRVLHIMDMAGNVTSFRLVEATNAQLVVMAPDGPQAIGVARIASVVIDRDSLWNGLLIGGAIGSAVALISPGGAEQPSKAGLAAAGFTLGAAIGTWSDWRRKGQTVVYRAP
jgi:hypothetical protein